MSKETYQERELFVTWEYKATPYAPCQCICCQGAAPIQWFANIKEIVDTKGTKWKLFDPSEPTSGYEHHYIISTQTSLLQRLGPLCSACYLTRNHGQTRIKKAVEADSPDKEPDAD